MTAALICGSSGTVQSADAAEAAPQEAPQEAPKSAPVNLQVLPRDISLARLDKLMKGYGRDLGVSCSYCHVENRETQTVDYVSDENPKKETGRIMIAMLEDINGRHLAQLGWDTRYAADVSCGSCHQGRASPPPWEARAR